MFKRVFLVLMMLLLLVPTSIAFADGPPERNPPPTACGTDGQPDCVTIQDGTLLTTDGRVITTGYDEWGYNYQAHMFNGGYCDAYRDAAWCQEYKDTNLKMKWNDPWLSNKDCNDDGLLDRHFGHDAYIGSGAWLTNHQSGGKGQDHWTYFVKIVAKPTADYDCTIGGGEQIWGSFCTIQEVESGEGVTLNVAPNVPVGFGAWK